MIFALPSDKQKLGRGDGAQAYFISEYRHQGLWGKSALQGGPLLGAGPVLGMNADTISKKATERRRAPVQA